MPLDTAATTAALWRAVQHLVSGGGTSTTAVSVHETHISYPFLTKGRRRQYVRPRIQPLVNGGIGAAAHWKFFASCRRCRARSAWPFWYPRLIKATVRPLVPQPRGPHAALEVALWLRYLNPHSPDDAAILRAPWDGSGRKFSKLRGIEWGGDGGPDG
jgi:hypothetical protein